MKKEHRHNPSCYGVVCRTDEHEHGKSCVKVWTCGKDGHTHNDGCFKYDAKDDVADCNEHVHSDACGTQLSCMVEEDHEHSLDAECYTLVCELEASHTHVDDCYPTKEVPVVLPYTGPIDANWAIYIKDKSSYIKSAEFAVSPEDAEEKLTIADKDCNKYVKITFQGAYDELDSDDVDFYFYIADVKTGTLNKDKLISEKVEVHYLFDNWEIKYVDFDFINEVEFKNMRWVTKAGKAGKGTASFCFFKEAYVVAKMNPEEEVIFSYDNSYDKDLDKAYNYDADILSYNFKGTKDEFNRAADVIIPADDDSFIYEVVNGKAVEVEAEYVEDYEVIKGTKVDGWVIETNELGYYIVSDIELEVVEEEVEAEVEVEAEKANPETGAADFVGAAVAMAVVSVAAAGALALKK